jgi:COX assembly protein 2
MHPPLDRPHPMCQDEIRDLKKCHDTNSKFKFWACNDVKYALDACFKKEKKVLLEELNKDYEKKRQAEEDAFQSAMGHSISFEEYLKKDADFIKATSTTR